VEFCGSKLLSPMLRIGPLPASSRDSPHHRGCPLAPPAKGQAPSAGGWG
jgi:hypothetical protein